MGKSIGYLQDMLQMRTAEAERGWMDKLQEDRVMRISDAAPVQGTRGRPYYFLAEIVPKEHGDLKEQRK
ncbi:hypothetical protein V1478_008973 [Vespula squamosa]|uniref:Uncharacterized protein n=1 Tax=Vespula squamosa TaxID=30214 RepID=A0ABD2AXQ2_VESSQ